MLAARFYVFYTILWFFAFFSSANADAVCDSLAYGQPTYTDCRDLVLALQRPEYKLRFFALRAESPPYWIPHLARNQRTRLPLLMGQG